MLIVYFNFAHFLQNYLSDYIMDGKGWEGIRDGTGRNGKGRDGKGRDGKGWEWMGMDGK